jgi:nucleotide-binding universal stress UspA family protein
MKDTPTVESNGRTAADDESIRLKTILVPVDFSEQAKFALRYATRLAEKMGGKVIVLHVMESPLGYYGYEPGVAEALTNQAQHSLDQACQTDAIKLEHVETMVRLAVESVAKEIVLAAREVAADLIVVPANHRGGFTHDLFAHTADKIGHHAPCPVLMVPVPASAAVGIEDHP